MTVAELIQKLSEFDGDLEVELSAVISRSPVWTVEEEVDYSDAMRMKVVLS